jgi:hypothetical protein
MRTISTMLYTFFTAAQALAAPCEVYEHKNFSGPFVAVERNQSMPRLGALNDRVSSIKIDPQCLVVAFADEEYRGGMITFGPGEHPTLPEGWDDQISSLRCNCR